MIVSQLLVLPGGTCATGSVYRLFGEVGKQLVGNDCEPIPCDDPTNPECGDDDEGVKDLGSQNGGKFNDKPNQVNGIGSGGGNTNNINAATLAAPGPGVTIRGLPGDKWVLTFTEEFVKDGPRIITVYVPTATGNGCIAYLVKITGAGDWPLSANTKSMAVANDYPENIQIPLTQSNGVPCGKCICVKTGNELIIIEGHKRVPRHCLCKTCPACLRQEDPCGCDDCGRCVSSGDNSEGGDGVILPFTWL